MTREERWGETVVDWLIGATLTSSVYLAITDTRYTRQLVEDNL